MGGSYLSKEMQSVYSTTSADMAIRSWVFFHQWNKKKKEQKINLPRLLDQLFKIFLENQNVLRTLQTYP